MIRRGALLLALVAVLAAGTAGARPASYPKTRAALKEKMPKYYKFLVELFGFDPEPEATPVAEAPKPDAQPAAMMPGGT